MKKETYIPELKLTIPSNNLFLETALGFIENAARVFEFSEQEIFQVRLAAEEAVSNIIKHGFSNDIRESFTIVCRLESAQFVIVLYEKGKPFEIEKIAQYNPDQVDVDGDIKGLGSFLMRQYMDIVEYKNLGREGKETVLVKYPKSQRFDAVLKNSASKKEKVENFRYRIKNFEEEDAIGISECAYSAYGYTYSSYIYYPSKIIEMNRTGVMKSIVAQNIDTKEIIAHAALKYNNNSSVAEMGVLFVKKEYRGNNVFAEIAEHLNNAYKSIDTRGMLKCLFAKAVTSHPISQNMLLKKGAFPIALILALFPSNVNFKDLVGEVTQKDAALLLALNIDEENKQRIIYSPEKHRRTIENIFSDLKYSFVSSSPKSCNETEIRDTKIDYKILDIFNCAEIYCSGYEKETPKKIHSVMKTLCLNRVDAIYLYLDLENPMLEYVAQECEKFGFFFAGVLPFGIDGRHSVIYQYLNNLKFDFENIKVSHPKAVELKNYIQKCYNEVTG